MEYMYTEAALHASASQWQVPCEASMWAWCRSMDVDAGVAGRGSGTTRLLLLPRARTNGDTPEPTSPSTGGESEGSALNGDTGVEEGFARSVGA